MNTDNLEHNVKEAFAKNDAQTTLPSKESMWERIDASIHTKKGVAVFWRVAAIFLGLIITAGIFAAASYNSKQNKKVENLLSKQQVMQNTIDSLLTLPAKIRTETKVVEKIIYRGQEAIQRKDIEWKGRYQDLSDSIMIILASHDLLLKNELETLRSELKILNAKLEGYKNKVDTPAINTNEPFILKSDKVELGVQKKPSVRSSDIQIKIFEKSFIGTPNNLNKSLFKNEL